MAKSDITYEHLCGKWSSPEFGDFIIFEYCDKYYISFHETYKWGKKIEEIKYFIWHVGNDEFYFEKGRKFYELWYNIEKSNIIIKLCDLCNRK